MKEDKLYVKCYRKGIIIPSLRLSFVKGDEVYEITPKQYEKIKNFRYIEKTTKEEFEKNKGKFKEFNNKIDETKKVKSFKKLEKGD